MESLAEAHRLVDNARADLAREPAESFLRDTPSFPRHTVAVGETNVSGQKKPARPGDLECQSEFEVGR